MCRVKSLREQTVKFESPHVSSRCSKARRNIFQKKNKVNTFLIFALKDPNIKNMQHTFKPPGKPFNCDGCGIKVVPKDIYKNEVPTVIAHVWLSDEAYDNGEAHLSFCAACSFEKNFVTIDDLYAHGEVYIVKKRYASTNHLMG